MAGSGIWTVLPQQYNDYITTEYQIFIDEKADVIKLKPKCFYDIKFAVFLLPSRRFCNIYVGSLQAN